MHMFVRKVLRTVFIEIQFSLGIQKKLLIFPSDNFMATEKFLYVKFVSFRKTHFEKKYIYIYIYVEKSTK